MNSSAFVKKDAMVIEIKKKRSGMLLLSAALTAIVFIVLAGSIVGLYSGMFSMVESGRTASVAQRYAEIEANTLTLLPYDELTSAAHGKKNIEGAAEWQSETLLGAEKVIDGDHRQRIATVKIYKAAESVPRANLQVPLSSKGSGASVPVGTVIWYAAEVPPKGFIECTGQSTAQYPKLASIVGAHVPDLRGEFIRGWDHGRGVDAGRAFASYQEDMLIDHSHSLTLRGRTGKDSSWDPTPYWSSGDYGYTAPTPAITSGILDVPFGNENRPKNVALLPCIKHD